jgi:hypothetical protein
LSPRELQGQYQAALSKIAAEATGTSERHSPIYQRQPVISEKQAIKDAATALTALWKIGPNSKR